MLAYLQRLYSEAKSKVTTYLALGVAALSQAADHAQELHDSFSGDLQKYLPSGPLVAKGLHYLLSALGFLIIWSRVRRFIAAPKP